MKKSFFRNFALISQLSINIIVTTFFCLVIGMWIDSKFGTSFWAVIMLILGILGGGKSAYTIAMNSLEMDKKKEEKPEDIVERYNREHGEGVNNEKSFGKN